jgi:sporulation protein YlmC with PRC-barrel domain
MELGKHVLDKELLDRSRSRCGKVDDLVLEFPEENARPIVTALVVGPLALAHRVGRPAVWLARVWYRFVRVPDPQPIEIPWAHVSAIDVTVHLDMESEGIPLQLVARTARRIVSRIPGS